MSLARRIGMLPATALTLMLAACATPGDGLDVALVQLRSDVADRHLQVRVHNTGADAVEIGAVEVDDARFAQPAVRTDPDRITTVRPGSTVDVRVALPAMDCGTEQGGAAPRVRLELAASGTVADLPATDLLGVLAPIHERDCRADRLAAVADVAFGAFRPSVHPTPAQLELTVTPVGGGDATLRGIQPTNLLRFAGTPVAADTLPLDLDARDPAVVVLPLVPLRCDPHAVQEDKRGTVFTLEVELGAEAGEVELAASPDQRARILAWVSQWCAG